jgi:hypothetical protein
MHYFYVLFGVSLGLVTPSTAFGVTVKIALSKKVARCQVCALARRLPLTI